MANDEQIINDVKCAGCSNNVFESVLLQTATPTKKDRNPTTYIVDTKLKQDAPPLCTDGNGHRVDLTDLL